MAKMMKSNSTKSAKAKLTLTPRHKLPTGHSVKRGVQIHGTNPKRSKDKLRKELSNW